MSTSRTTNFSSPASTIFGLEAGLSEVLVGVKSPYDAATGCIVSPRDVASGQATG